MYLQEFTRAAAFSAAALPFLEAHEAVNNLFLGILENVGAGDYDHTDAFMALVRHTDATDGRVLTAAIRTPPHPVILAYAPGPLPPEAVEALVERLVERYGARFVGLTGERSGVAPFVEAIGSRIDRELQRRMAMRVYELCGINSPVQPLGTEVVGMEAASGGARRPALRDRPVLREWIREFYREALREEPDEKTLEQSLERYLSSDPARRGLLLWEDEGRLVSMAGYSGPTPHGIRVNAVYTPPSLRGRGYATACTAELSRQLLEGGREFCFLFADLENPTSNRIYQDIGYQAVADMETWSVV